MADMPIAYREAHCCLYCRHYVLRRVRRFLRRASITIYCSFLKRDVLPTCRCSRFRWDAEHRPPTPRKPAAVGGEVRDASDG